MSEAAVNAALRRMGYDIQTEICGHGFRAMARTILHEELHQKPCVDEPQRHKPGADLPAGSLVILSPSRPILKLYRCLIRY